MTTSIVEGRKERILLHGSLYGCAADGDGRRLADVELLFPADGADFQARHPVSMKEWNGIKGL